MQVLQIQFPSIGYKLSLIVVSISQKGKPKVLDAVVFDFLQWLLIDKLTTNDYLLTGDQQWLLSV